MAVRVTYREIAERFGIGVEGARLKAKRRAAKGLWRIVPGNHPQDAVRVEVPEEEWAAPNVGRPTDPNAGTPANPPQHDTQRRDTNDLEVLVELISQLHAQSAAMTNRVVDAERGRAEAEKEAAIIGALLEAAESRLTVVQEQHLADLKRVREQHLADLKRVRDQMEAETARAVTELANWKARPWWKRLAR
jgi:hypothetical protein